MTRTSSSASPPCCSAVRIMEEAGCVTLQRRTPVPIGPGERRRRTVDPPDHAPDSFEKIHRLVLARHAYNFHVLPLWHLRRAHHKPGRAANMCNGAVIIGCKARDVRRGAWTPLPCEIYVYMFTYGSCRILFVVMR
jgi:hypothetical protein